MTNSFDPQTYFYNYTGKGDTYVRGSKGIVDYSLSPTRQKWDSTKIKVEK